MKDFKHDPEWEDVEASLPELGPKRRPRYFVYDHDAYDDDCEETIDLPADEVIRILRIIEGLQFALTIHAGRLANWWEQSQQFSEIWEEFTRVGGVTSTDFERFLAGRFRYRRTRQKDQLRLIQF